MSEGDCAARRRPRWARRQRPPELVEALRSFHESRRALEEARAAYKAARERHQVNKTRLLDIRRRLAEGDPALAAPPPPQLPAAVRAGAARALAELRTRRGVRVPDP